MKINFSFSKLLDNDLFVKIMSVVIAIVAWFIVVVTIDTNQLAEIRNIPVKFDLVGTAAESYGLSLVEGEGQTIDVKVEGKKYIIGNLKPEDFIVTPILTSVTKPGEYHLNIDVRKSNLRDNDYQIKSDTTSTTVTATFDFLVEETFPIVAVADNVAATDEFVKEAVLASPDKITLKGPQNEISKIKKVVLENDIEKQVDDALILEGKPKFYDENGGAIQLKNVTYQDQPFEINVQVYKHATVPLQVTFVNVPTGLQTDKLAYTLSEEFIEIAGPKDIINKVGFVNLGEIDFRKINVGSAFGMEVSLPAGTVNVNDIKHVTLTVNSDNLAKKQLSVSNFSKKNEPVGYTTKIETKAINDVKIVGDTIDVAALSANDLIAVVDLQNVDFTSGKAKVPVLIYCSGNKFAWAVGEYNVLVSAVKK